VDIAVGQAREAIVISGREGAWVVGSVDTTSAEVDESFGPFNDTIDSSWKTNLLSAVTKVCPNPFRSYGSMIRAKEWE
jgi:hypothetical protein